MSTCHVCGCDTTEDARMVHFGGTDYHFCRNHDNDEYIVTDYDGQVGPASLSTRAYNGESNMRRSELCIFLPGRRSGEIGACDSCGYRFYGSMAWIEDTEEEYCCYCAHEHAVWSENLEAWYSSSDSLYDAEERARGHEPSNRSGSRSGYALFPGTATDRFLAEPMVGIEFEHAPVMDKLRPYVESDCLFQVVNKSDDPEHNQTHFVYHSDGSICSMSGYASCEIVSMPASGDELEWVINKFYEPFASKQFVPGPEHPSCGFHMHVASRFLRKFTHDGLEARNISSRDRTSIITMLNAINTICREFISSSRRANTYCSDRPSMRPKNLHAPGGSEMTSFFTLGNYPSIAIRSIGTIEFRLWPSSNSKRYTMARAELSQKIINYFDKCILDDNGVVSVDHDHVKELVDITEMCAPTTRVLLVNALALLLGLSVTTIGALNEMGEKFNPLSHGKSKFKFTKKQLGALVDDPSAAYISGFVGDDIVSSGDTTVEVNRNGSRDLYFAFGENPKCYPAVTEGAHTEFIVKMAKGEL